MRKTFQAFIFVAILFVASHSHAATYYIDNTCPNDGDGTASTCAGAPGGAGPWNTLASVVQSAGSNSYLFAKGNTFTLSATMSVSASGTDTDNRLIFGSFGTGAAPIIDADSGAFPVVTIQNRSNVTIQDLDIRNSGTTNGVVISATTTNVSNVEVNGCTVSGNALNGVHVTNSNATYELSNIDVIDSTIHDNGQHGVQFMAHVNGGDIQGNTVYANGLTSDSQGICVMAVRDKLASGWSNTSGTIYSKAVAGHTVFNVIDLISTDRWLTENTATPTAPGVGEWGVSEGVGYVNTGEDPNTDLMVQLTRCRNITISGNQVYNQNKVSAEGKGIFADDLSENIIIEGNIIHDNEGYAISTYAGNGIEISNNVIYSSTRGININKASTNVRVYNNTIDVSEVGFYGWEWHVSPVEIKNNIFNGGTYGLADISGQNDVVSGNNIVYGQSTARFSGVTEDATDINSDPLFVSALTGDFHLTGSSPAIDSGLDMSAYYTVDADSIARPQSLGWDIGAYEYDGPDPLSGNAVAGSGGGGTVGAGGSMGIQ